MKCPLCGQEHADDALFCPITGKKIEFVKFCMSCGAPLEPGWKICAKCGVPVGEIASGEKPYIEKPRKKFTWLKLTCLGIFIASAACVLLSAIFLFVDPLGLNIPGRILGRYDAAAESMPADTNLYVGVNLLNARPNSLERFMPLALPLGYFSRYSNPFALDEGGDSNNANQGIEQALGEIEKSTGVKFPDDFIPWIGQYIGVGVLGLSGGQGDDPGLVIAMEARSRGGADRFLADLEKNLADRQDMQFDRVDYQGTSIAVQDSGMYQEALAFCRTGNMVLFATNEEAIKEAIDARGKKNIADQQSYKQLMQKSPRNSLVRLFVPSEWLKDLVDQSAGGYAGDLFVLSTSPLYEAWAGSLVSAGTTKSGLQVDLLNLYDKDELSSTARRNLESLGGKYPSIEHLPESTVLYFSGKQFDETVQVLLDAIPGGAGGAGLIDELFPSAMGVSLNDDLLAYLDGDWVIALAPSTGSLVPTQGETGIGILGLFGTSDETEIADTVARVSEGFSALGLAEVDELQSEGGTTYKITDRYSDQAIFLGIHSGYFLLGTGSDLLDETVSQSRQLIDSKGYRQVLPAFPAGMTPTFFVDIQELLDTIRNSQPDSESESINNIAVYLKDVQSLAAGQELMGDDIVRTHLILFSRNR